MKKCLLSVLFALSILAQGQTIKIKEPDFIGRMLFANDTIGDGIAIAQSTVRAVKSDSGLPFMPIVGMFNNTIYYNVLSGLTSALVIKKTNNLSFIVRVQDNNVDPNEMLAVVKMNVNPKKQLRYIELFSESSDKKITQAPIPYVKFHASKYGNNSYLLQIDSIDRGEYFIMSVSNRNVYNTFSIQ